MKLSELTRTNQGVPCEAPLTNAPGHRSPEQLRAVLAQFDVAHHPHYAPRDGMTFCNIFAWHATHALGAEIPHRIPDATQPAGYRELNVNATIGWLEQVGPSAGYSEVDALAAGERADRGEVVAVLWKNPTGAHGHIGILLPTKNGEIRVAAAGGVCLFDCRLTQTFGNAKPLRFFAHA